MLGRSDINREWLPLAVSKQVVDLEAYKYCKLAMSQELEVRAQDQSRLAPTSWHPFVFCRFGQIRIPGSPRRLKSGFTTAVARKRRPIQHRPRLRLAHTATQRRHDGPSLLAVRGTAHGIPGNTECPS